MATSPPETSIAIIAALEQEIRPLVQGWRVHYREYAGRRYKFFEDINAVAVCGGIGERSATFAAQAGVALYSPAVLISAGFAGSLAAELECGQVFCASRVLDAASGRIYESESGTGTLLSVTEVVGREGKHRLGNNFNASAVDMEAAAVAEVAARSHLKFMAVKVILDELDVELPPMRDFVSPDGGFATGRFLRGLAFQPARWPMTFRLARNARQAARALAPALRQLANQQPSGGFKVKSGLAHINC